MIMPKIGYCIFFYTGKKGDKGVDSAEAEPMDSSTNGSAPQE